MNKEICVYPSMISCRHDLGTSFALRLTSSINPHLALPCYTFKWEENPNFFSVCIFIIYIYVLLYTIYVLLTYIYLCTTILYLKCVCVFSCIWLSVTPWAFAYQTPLSMGFSRQEYRSELPFPIPGDLPNPGIISVYPAFQVDSLLLEPSDRPIP